MGRWARLALCGASQIASARPCETPARCLHYGHMGTPSKFDEARRAVFLEVLEHTGEVTAAAARAGVSRSCAYNTAKTDPEFADACEAALGRLDEERLKVFRRLAIDGVTKTTYDKDGNVVAVTKVFSERLLLAWIKRHKPVEWGDKVQIDQTVTEVRAFVPQDIPKEAARKLRIALAALPSPEGE